MKLAFIASFIIGGLLWLSVFQVNNNMFSHSGRQTLYQSVKVKNEALAQLMERDIRRVGFRVPEGNPSHGILEAKNDEFEFVSMFEGPNSINPPVIVSWKVSGMESFASLQACIDEGGEDLLMTRTVKNAGLAPEDDGFIIEEITYEVGAICFSFRYFDLNMEEAATGLTLPHNNIRHIGFVLMSESEQRYGDRHERHALERTVTPRNLNLGS